MINPHLPAVPQAPPAIPHHPGRRRQNGIPYTPIVPDNTSIHHPPFQTYAPHHSQTHHRPSQNYQQTQHYTNPYLPQAIQSHPQQHYSHQQPLVVSSYPASQHSSHVSHHSQPILPSQAPPQASAPSATPVVQPTPRAMTPVKREPFYPPVPWLSVPEEPFPPRAPRRRRKRRAPQSSTSPLELPSSQPRSPTPEADSTQESEATDLITQSESETPSSQPPSEVDSTHPTTPSSALPSSSPASQPSTNPNSISTRTLLTAIPFVPAVPHLLALPKQPPRESVAAAATIPSKAPDSSLESTAAQVHPPDSNPAEPITVSPDSDQTPKPVPPPLKAPPKSWADLVRTNTAKAATGGASGTSNDVAKTNGFDVPRANSLADVLSSFSVGEDTEGDSKVPFLEPRGLVNTGNMCYMNSVLQILVFCVPLYGFLDRVGKRAAHSFKSDTPLIDAMIMFMREFPVIDSTASIEQLRMRLKDNELEQFGEAFIPEYVYSAIRHLPRFSSLQRGHQQDAEEFLGFLLGGLHDECVQVMKNSGTSNPSFTATSPVNGAASHTTETPSLSTEETSGGWLEVGPKQRPTVTRLSGAITTESPITKIFGGKLRSELRVPGLKTSVTLEPYQPLQLDIQSPQVNNITDALKNLTHLESLNGDFNSPRGPGATATKQVFVETLPPVLILHLKRFQYNNTGGTQKIWKKVGYPLELEIPREVFPHKRGLVAQGRLPKYQLIGVVYHHGKNASGGHYTVDVRRQDGSEWIRLDDTVIRRVRSEDVAEAGSEETPKVSATSPDSHKNDHPGNANTYELAGPEDGEDAWNDGEGWKQVNGLGSAATGGGKRAWSVGANGSGAGANSATKGKPNEKSSVKDNKVAYLLFYQKTKL